MSEPGAATLFLDLDGTLIDPKPGITASIRAALAEMGAEVPPADALTWCIGPPIRQSFEILLGPGADIEEAVEAYRETFRAGAMFEAELYDGVGEMLDALDGLSLWIATSKLRSDAQTLVEHFGIHAHVEGVFGSAEDGSHSDKADLLTHALRETGADPAASVMLGDRRFDIEGARFNGLSTIGALWGYGGLDELRDADADALAGGPEDVPELVHDLLGVGA